MGVKDFSSARQWAPFAQDALARMQRDADGRRGPWHLLRPALGMNLLQFPWRGGAE